MITVRRAITCIALTLASLTGALSVGGGSAHAAAFVDGGEDDIYVIFSPAETAYINANMDWIRRNDGSPAICDVLKVGRASRACSMYRALGTVRWLQVRWFFSNAAAHGACGMWVIDGAWWRSPVIRSASRSSDGLGVAWVTPGRTEWVRSARGNLWFRC